jgi:transposase-like protein
MAMCQPTSRPSAQGYRHGQRSRTLTGTFGSTEIAVPRARLQAEDGTTTEWRSAALRAYQRRTQAADAVIASAYLSGTNTRRVHRALTARTRRCQANRRSPKSGFDQAKISICGSSSGMIASRAA